MGVVRSHWFLLRCSQRLSLPPPNNLSLGRAERGVTRVVYESYSSTSRNRILTNSSDRGRFCRRKREKVFSPQTIITLLFPSRSQALNIVLKGEGQGPTHAKQLHMQEAKEVYRLRARCSVPFKYLKSVGPQKDPREDLLLRGANQRGPMTRCPSQHNKGTFYYYDLGKAT